MALSDGPHRAERSPFPGLDPFTASDDDAAVFGGRDAECDLVTANLRVAPLTILYGPSGVGKSSLLRAGVVHQVRYPPRGRRPARVPPPTVIMHDEWAGDAGDALARRVVAALGEEAGDEVPAVDVALERWADQGRGQLFVILDQFEEYLGLHRDSEGDSFDELFPRLAGRDDLPVHFLISLRDDALAELDRYQGRMPGLFANYLRVSHMDEASARSSVVEAIACVNAWRQQAGHPRVEVDAGLLDEVFADLTDPTLLSGHRGGAAAGRAPIELAFLQLVMRRLWEADVHGDTPVLRRSTLRGLGGTNAIVAGHLDRQMETLTKAHRDTAAAIFGYLVTPSGAKIRYTPADLAGYADRPEAAVAEVLEALSRPDLRIMRRVPAPSGDPNAHGFEIFHDVLAGAVRGWALRNRAARLERLSRRLGAALAAAIAAVLALLAFVTNPGLLETADLRSVDMRFGVRGNVSVDPSVLLVGIDDRTLASPIVQKPPAPPISRADQARVLDAIDAGRPQAIVETVEYKAAGDAVDTNRLKSSLERARSPIVLATSRIDDVGQTSLFGDTPLSGRNSLREFNATVGYAGFTPDRDGAVRHVRDEGRQVVGSLGLPTLAVAALTATAREVKRTRDTTARAARPVPRQLKAVRTLIDDFPKNGAWVDYAGGRGTYPHVSFVDVRNRQVSPERFKDKIVVVGTTSLAVPGSQPTSAAGGSTMAGPEIVANAIATLLAGFSLRDAPAWASVLIILALAIVPAVLATYLRTTVAVGLSLAAGAIFLVAAQLAFGRGWILPVVAPLLALLVSTVTSQLAMRMQPRGGAPTRTVSDVQSEPLT